MIPSHILNEIALRLRNADPSQTEKLAVAMGIDLVAAANPLPSIYETERASHYGDELPIGGAVPFEMKLWVLGKEVTHTCRAAFSAELVDDVDRRTGEPIRSLGRVEIAWQTLDWRDLDETDDATGEHSRAAAPAWSESFEALLPTAVEPLVLDMIEEQARLLELGA